MEHMFSSTSPVSFLPCGHGIHQTCYQQYLAANHHQCPTCKKSVGRDPYRDQQIEQYLRVNPMPPEYTGWIAVILCNDCLLQSEAPFHFAFHKCTHCDSYNTDVISKGPNPDSTATAGTDSTTASSTASSTSSTAANSLPTEAQVDAVLRNIVSNARQLRTIDDEDENGGFDDDEEDAYGDYGGEYEDDEEEDDESLDEIEEEDDDDDEANGDEHLPERSTNSMHDVATHPAPIITPPTATATVSPAATSDAALTTTTTTSANSDTNHSSS
jgi:hypothetical protein